MQARLVSISIAILLAAIYGAYSTGTLTEIPCQNTLLNSAVRDFIHVDSYHLIVNLLGLYYVSTLEQKVGPLHYTAVISGIVAISAVLTFFVTKVLAVNCSIGFSGVILGLMSYTLARRGLHVSWQPILYLIAVSASSRSPNVSVSGHLIGIVSGLLVALLTQWCLLQRRRR